MFRCIVSSGPVSNFNFSFAGLHAFYHGQGCQFGLFEAKYDKFGLF